MNDLRDFIISKNNMVRFRCEDEFYRCEECDFRNFDKDLNHMPNADFDIMFIKTIDGKILYDRNSPINEYEVELL